MSVLYLCMDYFVWIWLEKGFADVYVTEESFEMFICDDSLIVLRWPCVVDVLKSNYWLFVCVCVFHSYAALLHQKGIRS